MITEYCLKILQDGQGYRFTVKFWIGEECYCAEGSAGTKGECYDMAQKFEDDTIREMKIKDIA